MRRALGCAVLGVLLVEAAAHAQQGGFRIEGDGVALTLYGQASVEVIWTSTPTVSRTFPMYVESRPNEPRSTYTVTAQSTLLGFSIEGPAVGSFDTGAEIAFDFHGGSPVDNEFGAYFLFGYGELQNSDWRFLFGLNTDVLAPVAPEVLNWGGLIQAGNIGGPGVRGQVRGERYFRSPNSLWTVTLATTQPVITGFALDAEDVGQDAGVPNLEGRVSAAFGRERDGGSRTLEIGLSSAFGGIRSARGDDPTSVKDTWAVALDASVGGRRAGLRGELWTGQAIGSYQGAIGQSGNDNFDVIRATGGWAQAYIEFMPAVRVLAGYGLDDPRDEDLTSGQRARNEVAFGTLIWEPVPVIRLGYEVSAFVTDYVAPNRDNIGWIAHFRADYRF
jgi:hypothetical protein